MVKIKQKKKLNLPQLIEYAWENDVRDSEFQTVKNERGVFYEVYFSEEGNFCSNDELDSKDLFEIEIEEDIKEDTELGLIERFIGGMDYVCYTSYGNTNIKECLKRTPRDCTTTHFYIENDDRELILIWRDGKLVE